MRILKTGITTIQDCGRTGMRNWGLPVAGAMDRIALRLGNMLVANEPDSACLEISRGAFSTSFQRSSLVALTGTGFNAFINGRPIPYWQPFLVQEGEFLQLFPSSTGFTYLAIHGGIRIEPQFGSRSTHLSSKIGGLGRPLRAGDELPLTVWPDENGQRIIDHLKNPAPGHHIRLGNLTIPDYTRSELRFIAGPEYDWFTGEAINLLQSAPFTVSETSNRMGLRLNGPELKRKNAAELLSVAVMPGTMQVSPDGQILLLMADAQTTGGYPRIGQLAAVDLHLAAQYQPGKEYHFRQISIEQAEQLWVEQEKKLKTLERDYLLHFS
jgi:antagonist of KipI